MTHISFIKAFYFLFGFLFNINSVYTAVSFSLVCRICFWLPPRWIIPVRWRCVVPLPVRLQFCPYPMQEVRDGILLSLSAWCWFQRNMDDVFMPIIFFCDNITADKQVRLTKEWINAQGCPKNLLVDEILAEWLTVLLVWPWSSSIAQLIPLYFAVPVTPEYSHRYILLPLALKT